MKVYPKNMKKNYNLLGGLHNSQKLLLLLTQKGLSRQDAYLIIQKNSMKAWDKKKNFFEIIQNDKKIKKYISSEELKKTLEIDSNNKKIDWIFKNKIK